MPDTLGDVVDELHLTFASAHFRAATKCPPIVANRLLDQDPIGTPGAADLIQEAINLSRWVIVFLLGVGVATTLIWSAVFGTQEIGAQLVPDCDETSLTRRYSASGQSSVQGSSP